MRRREARLSVCGIASWTRSDRFQLRPVHVTLRRDADDAWLGAKYLAHSPPRVNHRAAGPGRADELPASGLDGAVLACPGRVPVQTRISSVHALVVKVYDDLRSIRGKLLGQHWEVHLVTHANPDQYVMTRRVVHDEISINIARRVHILGADDQKPLVITLDAPVRSDQKRAVEL